MKRRILAYFMRMLTAAVALTTVLMTLVTYGMFERRMIEDLSVDAQVLHPLLDSSDAGRVMDELNGALRVTIIGEDGVVRYDNCSDASRMDNHLNRPEVAQALKTGEGSDVRDSQTMDTSTFYYATRLEDGSVLRDWEYRDRKSVV